VIHRGAFLAQIMGNNVATGRTKLRQKLRDTLLLRRPAVLPEAERKRLHRALLAVKSKLRIDTEGHHFQDDYMVLKILGGGGPLPACSSCNLTFRKGLTSISHLNRVFFSVASSLWQSLPGGAQGKWIGICMQSNLCRGA
jgi:hypothetical protein